jgi:amino acid transporter
MTNTNDPIDNERRRETNAGVGGDHRADRPVDAEPARSVDANGAPVAERPVAYEQPVTSAASVASERRPATEPSADGRTVRQNVVAREKEEFGGFKFGSAFFGWLTATGTVVLLTALVAGAGAALGLGTETTRDDVTDVAQADAETIGIIGAIAVLVILLIAYYCGGYVAGRMARFSGAKQGIAVWLWAIVIAIVVAVVGAIAGSQYNVLSNLDTFPRIPIGEGDLTAAGIITAVLALVVSLAGAVLGGLAGMRYHRKVDRAGLGK